MSKHTPGPWRIAEGGTFANTIEAQSGRRNFDCDNGYRTVGTFRCCESTGLHKAEEENRAANGRLIAAAPELLDALEWLIALMPDPHLDPDQVQAEYVRKAIETVAKATGAKP